MSAVFLQMYTLREHTKDKAAYLSTLKRVAEIGYRGLQAKCPPFFSPEKFAATLREFGLYTDSLSCRLEALPEKLAALSAQAKLLGVDAVRVNSMPYALSTTAAGYREYAAKLEQAGALLRAQGLRLVYHFHAFEFINLPEGGRGIDLLLANTDAQNIFFQPDLFWLTAAGTEASESLALFAGRATSVHVKDYQILPRQEGTKEHIPCITAPVGCGNLNWKRIIPAALDIGIKSFVVEQDDCLGDPFDCIRVSLENLKKMGLGI